MVLNRAGAAPAGRALWLDVARGGAIVAMIAYHTAFDLKFFGVVDWPVEYHPAWRSFAASIASTFLFLVGVSLVAAHGGGVRWRAFVSRLAIVAAAAALVTVGTVLAVPAPIYFGILHAIATFSLLGIPFLVAPAVVSLAAAALVLWAPAVLTSPWFEGALFYPLGLSPIRPFTFDYEPIFPWFAATLLGIAFAKWFPVRPRRADVVPLPRAIAVLAAAGRNSLAIYLLHQPVIFAVLLLIQFSAG